MPHRTALVVALAVTSLVAGCGQPAPEAVPPAVPPVERPAPGPLWTYLDQVDVSAARRVNEERTRACVADAGFMYWPDDPNHELMQDTLPFARAWGYGGLSISPVSTADLNAAFVRSLSGPDRERYEAALAGCASADVEESARAWQDDPEFADLHAELIGWALASVDDPRVHAADEPWSACMDEAGYDVGSPDDAEQQASAATNDGTFPDPEEVQQAEIALAVADLTCRASTGYDEATTAAWHVLQQEFVDAHRGQLETLVAAHAL
ncbi:hypothetical protein [Cellulomonas sp. P5_E12]